MTIKRILIANRGEVAVRIARTCRALGIETVAVYSDADRQALHVLESDTAVHIGGSAPGESYLKIDAIVKAATSTECDALHPGFGLLSENPALAEACAKVGVIFIGPPPKVMQMMGDKAAARKIAAQHDVPTVPGYDGEEQDIPKLQAKAKAIGYPVMIKAAAGGGGRGMRLVESGRAFAEAAEGARREAERAFGNGTLILEKAIVGGRHVEVQVLADARGNVVHLGERDCSVQRRHQKVIEETPSPAVDDELRERMGSAAVRLTSAVGYVNAGTVEFMLDASGEFYFLEMNTRLQVEHGVTEMRTGVDLVALQIAVANGEKLPFEQSGVRFDGHSIECRIYAEDPAKGYLPSPGVISRLELPAGDGVRNDAGTYEGDEISTYYDPMVSKVLTWGRTRMQAIERMEEALASFRIEGVKTNVSLLKTVIAHPAFRAGEITTDFLDTKLPPEALAGPSPEEALLAAFGFLLLEGDSSDPWRTAGPLRGSGRAHLDIEHDGQVHVLTGRRMAGARHKWMVTLDGDKRPVTFGTAGDRLIVENDGHRTASRIVPRPGGADVTTAEHTFAFAWSLGEAQRGTAETHRQHGLTAPMPGLVLKVLAKAGDPVRAHQTLVVLEAMKMEHSIEAPHDGVVKTVHCKEGGRVGEGDLLIELEPVATQ